MRKLLILFMCLTQVVGFAPGALKARQVRQDEDSPPNLLKQPPLVTPRNQVKTLGNAVVGLTSGALVLVQGAWAGEEMEMADLPPPWIPVIFGVGLLVGVGVLTGSLSSVIDEEASLGMQSGARAKKEIERSQSSYFKKK